jgi:hypothetical protein
VKTLYTRINTQQAESIQSRIKFFLLSYGVFDVINIHGIDTQFQIAKCPEIASMAFGYPEKWFLAYNLTFCKSYLYSICLFLLKYPHGGQ